jgi:hypothetical protein
MGIYICDPIMKEFSLQSIIILETNPIYHDYFYLQDKTIARGITKNERNDIG